MSENKSLEIDKLFSQFKKLRSKKKITEKNMNIFSNKLLGISYEKPKTAFGEYVQGAPESFEYLASKINDIDLEHMTDVFGELISQN
ncbi:MAG: hypothetical protein VYD54_13130 [Bdellovibrionota bacterium]|nr:hypothetical protein [Bdellovibrionota bacterium]